MKEDNDMTIFDNHLKNQLKDKSFKAEFDALETQYEFLQKIAEGLGKEPHIELK